MEKIFCGNCGFQNLSTNNYCNNCGFDLKSEFKGIENEEVMENVPNVLTNDSSPSNKISDKNKIRLFFAGIIVLVIIYNLVVHHSVTHDYNDKQIYSADDMQIDAYLFSQEFVKENIKSPTTASFPTSDYKCFVNQYDSTYTVKSYVDAQNGFGAMIRSKYMVEMKYTGGNADDGHNWTLLDIRIYDGN